MPPKKRKLDELAKIKLEPETSPTAGPIVISPGVVGISRSISACSRCRAKKIKCDQRFPKCSKCAKSGTECIGLDPMTGREVPRSYVVHLEEKVTYLESQLSLHGIDIETPDESAAASLVENEIPEQPNTHSNTYAFSKLMTAATKIHRRNLQETPHEDTPTVPPELPAILPPKYTALYFLQIFFAQSNSQVPVLHREEFIKSYFIPIYGPFDYDEVSLASNFTPINKAFLEENVDASTPWFDQYKEKLQKALELGSHNGDIKKMSNDIQPPRKYHKCLYFLHMVFAIASSVNHLQYPTTISESFRLAAVKCSEDIYNLPDQLESLQAVILHAVYSTMRSTTPAVWYVLGIALRMCVDLDLHNEANSTTTNNMDFYTIDKRRRLFWCAYSIDRQICFYLDRPVGIPDESINTPFPSSLDDAQIFVGSKGNPLPSYKTISLAMFRVRKIQSEIQKVLYTNYEVPRAYRDLKEWKNTMLSKLNAWIKNIPTSPSQMNCDFNLVFFYINYHHTNLMLHNLAPKNFKLSVFDFEQVHQSSKELIRCYTQLLSTKSINYTWAAVHNLFSAGTSYLYAVYNSAEIYQATLLAEVKQVTSECLNILESLIDRFEAALKYYEVFQSLTMAIIKLKYNKTVKGYSSLQVTFESLRKISNTSVHSSVSKLVEHMQKDESFKEPLNDLLDPLNQSDTKLTLKSQADASVANTPAFEWLSASYDAKYKSPLNGNPPPTVKEVSKKYTSSVDATTPPPLDSDYPHNQYDFDNFFKELENLSPTSTHVSYRANEGVGPSLTHEGKKTFELIHQQPNEVIWDQFFTRASTLSFELSKPKDEEL